MNEGDAEPSTEVDNNNFSSIVMGVSALYIHHTIEFGLSFPGVHLGTVNILNPDIIRIYILKCLRHNSLGKTFILGKVEGKRKEQPVIIVLRWGREGKGGRWMDRLRYIGNE